MARSAQETAEYACSHWRFAHDSGVNRLSGALDPVAEPDFGRAAAIALIGMVAKLGSGVVIAIVLSGGDLDSRASEGGKAAMAVLSSLVGFLGLALALKRLLPTSDGRALLIAVLYCLVGLIVVGIPYLLLAAIVE